MTDDNSANHFLPEVKSKSRADKLAQQILDDDDTTAPSTEAASRTIVLVIAERERRDGKYSAWHNGEFIVADSRQPFVDAARILLSRGVDPASPPVMRRSPDGPDALRSIVGAAAKLTVEETPRGPRFNIWRSFPTEGA